MRLPARRDSRRKQVTFGIVQVREFQRIPGSHPDCLDGPSLSISWRFVQKDDVKVATFEQRRDQHGVKLQPLNAATRHFILHHVFDVPREKLKRSEKLARRVRLQRQATYREWKREAKDSKMTGESHSKLASLPEFTIKPRANTISATTNGIHKNTETRMSLLSSVRQSLRMGRTKSKTMSRSN